MALINSLISVLLLIALISLSSAERNVKIKVEYQRSRDVDIETYKIDSPNAYAAYRLDINNIRNISLDQDYTLFELLPKEDTLAVR